MPVLQKTANRPNQLTEKSGVAATLCHRSPKWDRNVPAPMAKRFILGRLGIIVPTSLSRLAGIFGLLGRFLPGGFSSTLVVESEGCGQFVKFFAVGIREVSRFERIVLEVVQLVWREWRVVYQFPVAPAEGVIVLPVVSQAAFAPDKNKVTVERLRLAKHGRQDAFSLNVSGHISSRHGAGCGIQIHRNADEFAVCAGLDFAGPNGAGRHLQAALVHVLFSSAMIAVCATDVDLTAVVAAEYRQRVFVLSVFLQSIDHLPDAVVHVLDQRDQLGSLVADARFARFHFFEPILRRLNRCVRCVVGEIHEKRFILSFAIVHIIDAPIGDEIGCVAGRVDLPAVFAEVIDAVTTVLVVVVDHVAKEPLEIIEAAAVWRVGFLEAKVPLADDRRVVAGILQHVRQQGDILRQPAPVVLRMSPDDTRHTGDIRVGATQQSSAGRRADRAVGIERVEPHTVRHQLVEVWRLQILGAVGRQVAVAEIVDKYDQDVWLVCCEGGGWLAQSETRQGDEGGAKECVKIHGHSVARALGLEQVWGSGKRQGDHGKYEANYRCCLPALAGFVSPHSVGPDAGNLSLGQA